MRIVRAPIGALLAIVAAAAPSSGVAQVGTIGSASGPGGTVTGRVCLDLDRDGACAPEEPGIAGARVRFEDGRGARADEEGRFHAVDVTARIDLADRAAYGAHVVAVGGLEVRRRFELAPGGVAAVDLPVAPDDAPLGSAAEASSEGLPRIDGERVLWRLGGAAAGARIRVGAQEVRAGADGRWSIVVPLTEGENTVGFTVADDAGALALWLFEARVVRPSGGAVRIFPSGPRRLLQGRIRAAGDGAILAGVAAPGVAVQVGGRPVRTARDGRFGAWGDAGATVKAIAAAGAAELILDAAPGDRAFQGVLLGELELQAGGDAGLLASGRLAGSATGRWRGFEIEAGLDLDDRDRWGIGLASPRDVSGSLRVDPRRGFVETGDHAEATDANPERGRLWAAAVGHGLRLDLGAARTGLSEPELGRYDRPLFGARAEWEGALGPAHVRATAFGARTAADSNGLSTGAPCQDQLAATGGSLFYLSHQGVIAGSERVRVEWRDPISRLTVASRALASGRDYDLDAIGGRLLLTRPLATVRPLAALTAGDPFRAAEAWLVVDYERLDPSGGRSGLGGGELRALAGPVSLALGGAAEDRPGSDWQLARGGAEIDLGAPLRAKIDVARSEGELYGADGAGRLTSLDGGFGFGLPAPAGAGPATAIHARAEGELGPARWLGWWRERQAGYSDGSFDERIGARERGAIADSRAGPVTLRVGWVERRGAAPDDPDGLERRDEGRGFASAEMTAGPFEVGIEGLHEQVTLPERGSQSAAGLRAGWRASRELTLEAGHVQAFDLSGQIVDRTFTSAGASLRTPQGTLGVRAGWGPGLGPRVLLTGADSGEERQLYGTVAVDPWSEGSTAGEGSAVGGRQRVGAGTLFTEDRLSRDRWGVVAGRVVGASLSPARGLALVLSGEQGSRWIDGDELARSSAAFSVAWGPGAVRLDARGEVRKEGRGHQWVGGGGAAWSPTERLTLALRGWASDGEILERSARGGEGWLSAAWRSDPLSILARLGRVKDLRESVDRDAVVAAIAASVKVARRATVGLGADYGRQRVSGLRDDRLAGSVRAEIALAGPVDAGIEYARRGSLDGREIGDLDAVRGEAGLTMGSVRLALGYTLVGFRGSGIDPEEEDGRFYLRAVLAH